MIVFSLSSVPAYARGAETYCLTRRITHVTFPGDVQATRLGCSALGRSGVRDDERRGACRDRSARTRCWAYSARVRAAELRPSLLTSAPAPGNGSGGFFLTVVPMTRTRCEATC